MVLAGTSLVTTLPAPIIAFSPMVTWRGLLIRTIDAPFFTRVGSTSSQLPSAVAILALPWVGIINKRDLWPTNTLSSMVTPSQDEVWTEILQVFTSTRFLYFYDAPIFGVVTDDTSV